MLYERTYGASPSNTDPYTWGEGETFSREMQAEFFIRGNYPPYRNTMFAVHVTFELERDAWGDWSHKLISVVGYHPVSDDPDTGMLIIAGIGEHEINKAIEAEFYEREY